MDAPLSKKRMDRGTVDDNNRVNVKMRKRNYSNGGFGRIVAETSEVIHE